MRILIYETEHFEVAYPLIRLFDLPQNQLTIVTNEYCFDQLKDSLTGDMARYKWVIRKQQSKYQFLYRLYQEIKEDDTELVFFNTISAHFIFYALIIRQCRQTRFVVTLH